MTERIDISEHVQGICAALELPYDNVARLDIAPSSVKAVVFRTNESGHMYVEPTGEIAQDEMEFRIAT